MTNRAAYDAVLRARGSLTVWFSEQAIEGWRAAEARTGRGGQPKYSDLAIETALTLRGVFRLALRQTEGLMRPVRGSGEPQSPALLAAGWALHPASAATRAQVF